MTDSAPPPVPPPLAGSRGISREDGQVRCHHGGGRGGCGYWRGCGVGCGTPRVRLRDWGSRGRGGSRIRVKNPGMTPCSAGNRGIKYCPPGQGLLSARKSLQRFRSPAFLSPAGWYVVLNTQVSGQLFTRMQGGRQFRLVYCTCSNNSIPSSEGRELYLRICTTITRIRAP
jgi:hypothetical protein